MTPAPNNMYIPYSLKNIPYLNKFQYQKLLIGKVEDLLKRMRWKLYWFQNVGTKEKINTFGFKSTNYPPAMQELKAFEDEMVEIIASVETRNVTNQLQSRMQEDIARINQMDEIIVQADKSDNLYLMKPEEYFKHLKQNITKEYRKAPPSTLYKIDEEAATMANKFQVMDRVEGIAAKQSYITIKDHKEDFKSRPSFRLINPCNSNMGRMSKLILDRINQDVRNATNLNQWRSTEDMLKWFRNLEHKNTLSFIKFDIKTFYPTITKELLSRAIEFTKGFTSITEDEEEVIFHARKTLLVGQDNSTWVKKENPNFDVSMGSRDGAEIAETVGLYLLAKLEEKVFNKGECGLYRDDGNSVIKGNGQEVERVRKKLFKMFQDEGLDITAEANIKVVDFLDVILDLESGTYKPFSKPNSCTKYVSPESNHPPSIVKNIPEAVAKRLSGVSSSKEMFLAEVQPYQDAMYQAGYKDTLKYQEESQDEHRKRRKPREIIWFCPPYSRNISTNIGKKFLAALRRHFPPSSPLYKLFNTNKVKLSYSTCPSMLAIIKAHNSKITRGADQVVRPGCNCRGARSLACPMQGKCQTLSLVYRANVTSQEGNKNYVGQASNTFKLRYNNHVNSFINPKKKHSTSLATYIWNLNGRGVDNNISWEKVCLAMPYKRGDRYCQLCLSEKVFIARANMVETREEALNMRSEIMARCRHIFPHLLNNFFSSQLPVQPAPTELPDPVQQEDDVEPDPVEEAPPAEPPDQVQDQLADHESEPGRRQTRSMSKKANPSSP